MVSGFYIRFEKRILFSIGKGLGTMRNKITIGPPDPSLRFALAKFIHPYAHRDAGITTLTMWSVSDGLRAAKSLRVQIIKVLLGFIPAKMGKKFPLLAIRQVRAGLRPGQVKLGKIFPLLCHSNGLQEGLLPQAAIQTGQAGHVI